MQRISLLKYKLFWAAFICFNYQLCFAQHNEKLSLKIGDNAPKLGVSYWLKGTPFTYFKKNKVYIIEFWATWCQPCIKAFPHLSDLAVRYKDKITVLGVDAYERQTSTPISAVKSFVSKMGKTMNYSVAVDHEQFMEKHWMKAIGETGIPWSFIVNKESRIVWIGHPSMITPQLLDQVIRGTFDYLTLSLNRISDKYLRSLEDSLTYELYRYQSSPNNPGYKEMPDSALIAIEAYVKNEPRIKYAPNISKIIFRSLVQTNQQDSAFKFGSQAIVTQTYNSPLYTPVYPFILTEIERLQDRMTLRPQIYQLAISCCQKLIAELPGYYEPKYLKKIAGFYLRIGKTQNAMAQLEKAIKLFKLRNSYSPSDLAEYEIDRLQLLARPQSVPNTGVSEESVNNYRQCRPYLASENDSLKAEMVRYLYNINDSTIGRPDSLLSAIENAILLDVRLKNAPNIINWTFNALLQIHQQHSATEYGKKILRDTCTLVPGVSVITSTIAYYESKTDLTPELYQLGIDACKAFIGKIEPPYFKQYAPEFYRKMAAWYFKLGNKAEAIQMQEKGIEIYKSQINISNGDLVELQLELQRFKND
jgi:thiol-disulfide isomerase/thioredoxin/tetratricopeptide (TPR) repeat protein